MPILTYGGLIVTLREFEDRDQPRRAVVGTPADVAPPVWTPGPMTNQERVYHVAHGVPAVLAPLKGLVGALGSALH